MDLVAPQEEEYGPFEQAERDIRKHAMAHGYALTKKKSAFDKRTPPTIRRVDYRCAKGGIKRGEGVKRVTGTRMTECPFEVRLHRSEYSTWKVIVKDPFHNHEASEPSAFSQYRQPTEEQKAQVRSLHASGVSPRFIVASLLEEHPHSLVSLRDVYNEIARVKKERLGDLTPIEVLVMELRDDEMDWAFHYTTDEDGHVNFFFFAPNDAIELARQSPDVIFIDATYRTNRYNMPLIHFMAVTGIGKTVSIAMCFVASESEPMYRRAVSMFRQLIIGSVKIEVFLTDDDTSLKNALSAFYPSTPQLLCIWHINKNVETKVNKVWRVNTMSDEDNAANKEKRLDFLAKWQQASLKDLGYSSMAAY